MEEKVYDEPFYYIEEKLPGFEKAVLYDDLDEWTEEARRLVSGGVPIEAGIRWMTKEKYDSLDDCALIQLVKDLEHGRD